MGAGSRRGTILHRKAGASRSTILVFCVFRGRGGGECVSYPLQLCEGLSGVQF